jgi:hypothetical protein
MYFAFSPNPRSDQFEFNFPLSFWKNDIIQKYDDYLNLHPQVLTTFSDIVNESIQGFIMPSFGYQPISQEVLRTDFQASQQLYRPNINEANLMDKNFQLVLRHSDAYLTYFLMLEHFFYYFKSKDVNLGTWVLRTSTSDGEIIFNVKFNSIIFNGLSELSLNQAGQESNFSTFNLIFGFSTFDVSFNLPTVTDKFKS